MYICMYIYIKRYIYIYIYIYEDASNKTIAAAQSYVFNASGVTTIYFYFANVIYCYVLINLPFA